MDRFPSSIRAVALVHPFPSLLNGVMVGGLAVAAGGSPLTALTLAGAMICIQASIGSVNDVVDASVDALTKPFKPIPAGVASRGWAVIVGLSTGLAGLALSFLVGGPVVAGLGAAVLGAGLIYDLALKPTAWAGLCYSVAFMTVPVYGWWGAAGDLPPRSEILLPIAALAGPTLQLANGLVDLEADRLAGSRGPVVRMGRRWALTILALSQVAVHGVAWLSLTTGGALPSTVLLLAGSGLAAAGWSLSAAGDSSRREWGWKAQAASIVLLGGGWLAAAVAMPHD
jgi:4-hydroxybenzoate polyprenyltransferase